MSLTWLLDRPQGWLSSCIKFCFPMFYLYGVRTPESLAPGVERISEGDMLVTHCPGSGVS